MLCDDWNHRSVERPGSSSWLLEDDVHTIWLFFCSRSHSAALWPRLSFPTRQTWIFPNFFFFFFTRPQESWIWKLDQDYWLRRTSERQRHTTHRWQRCSKVICCNLKQVAHFWDDFQDSVLSVFWLVEGKKAKYWCLFNNRCIKPRDIWVVIQGQEGMTSGSILYGDTAFLPLSRCLSGNPAVEAWPSNTDTGRYIRSLTWRKAYLTHQ